MGKGLCPQKIFAVIKAVINKTGNGSVSLRGFCSVQWLEYKITKL